ncbi:hypothetical protein [Streptomyces sp. NPDC052701]|uniref:hypothetical protein n=1 Tax=Streptomyces sp. NPDC052701 TaxID=3155533 RepID=UPI00341D9C61
MSTDWHWEYDPDHAHVAGGIPAQVVAEVECLAGQLVHLARTDVDVITGDLDDLLRPHGRVVGQCERLHPALDGRVKGHPPIRVDAELTARSPIMNE